MNDLINIFLNFIPKDIALVILLYYEELDDAIFWYIERGHHNVFTDLSNENLLKISNCDYDFFNMQYKHYLQKQGYTNEFIKWKDENTIEFIKWASNRINYNKRMRKLIKIELEKLKEKEKDIYDWKSESKESIELLEEEFKRELTKQVDRDWYDTVPLEKILSEMRVHMNMHVIAFLYDFNIRGKKGCDKCSDRIRDIDICEKNITSRYFHNFKNLPINFKEKLETILIKNYRSKLNTVDGSYIEIKPEIKNCDGDNQLYFTGGGFSDKSFFTNRLKLHTLIMNMPHAKRTYNHRKYYNNNYFDELEGKNCEGIDTHQRKYPLEVSILDYFQK